MPAEHRSIITTAGTFYNHNGEMYFVNGNYYLWTPYEVQQPISTLDTSNDFWYNITRRDISG